MGANRLELDEDRGHGVLAFGHPYRNPVANKGAMGRREFVEVIRDETDKLETSFEKPGSLNR